MKSSNPDDYLWDNPEAAPKMLSRQNLDELFSSQLSNEELLESVELVRMWLGAEALPYLVELLQNSSRSQKLRSTAAVAVREIGAEPIAVTLRAWESSDDPTLRKLAQEALSWMR